MFIYAVGRSIRHGEQYPDYNEGTSIRSVFKGVETYGACDESVFPFRVPPPPRYAPGQGKRGVPGLHERSRLLLI